MANEERPTSGAPAGSGSWLEKLASGAGFGAAVTLAVVLAGAVASLYPNAIRGLALLPNDEPGGGAAWWFIILVALALVLLVVNQSSIYKKSGREQRALSSTLTNLDSQQSAFNESLDKLNAAVQRLNTLPSQSFLPALRDSYREAFELTLSCIGSNADEEETEIAIRAVLGAIIETAKDYDGAAQESVYGANIMLFRERCEPPLILDTLNLVTVTAGHLEYLGALELIPELSTSSASPGEEWGPDDRTRAIALPVPAESDDYFDQDEGRSKSVVLPGAPTSFVKRSFDAYPTMEVFVKALRESALHDVWVGHIVDYFTNSAGGGHHIRSFASLPVEPIAPRDGAARNLASVQSDPVAASRPAPTYPLAVLNLHAERPGLLEDNGGSLFAPLMGPFCSLLAILIVQWRAQRAATGDGDATAPQTRG